MVTESILSKKLLKLLLLIKLAEKIEGKTKLQKMIFLGKEEEDLDFGFEFTKYNYGPYSFELTTALDSLQAFELIEITTEISGSTKSGGFITKKFIYNITEKGKKVIGSESEKLKEVEPKIKLLVKKWNKVPRDKIIEHVYSKHM